MCVKAYPCVLPSVPTHPPSDKQEILCLYFTCSKWSRFSGEDCTDESLIAKILEFLTAFWMRVVAPKIFEMCVPRDLLPFILPQLNPDDTNDMDARNTDFFPSASPDENSELLDPLVEAQDCVVNTSPVDRTGTYTNEEICVAEALINVLNTPTHSRSSVCHHQDCGLTIFPWGGVTSTEILLTNTPLENWMMIFQALVKSGRVNLVDIHKW